MVGGYTFAGIMAVGLLYAIISGGLAVPFLAIVGLAAIVGGTFVASLYGLIMNANCK